MKRQLYISWQSHSSRKWYAVGVLTYEDERGYTFRYVKGAKTAAQAEGFSGISTFPDFDRSYSSERLFSFFSNRILSSTRPEYSELVEQVGLQAVGDTESPQYVFDFLRRTRGWRATDSFEMFAPVEKTDAGYRWDFFTRGVRHGDEAIQQRWVDEKPAEPVRPILDRHNSHDPTAVLIIDRKQRSLGFVPSNYSSTVYQILEHAVDVEITIVRHNRHAIPQKRFLLELKAQMHAEFQLTEPTELEPLVEVGESAA
jgi:hypothetical protein